MKKLRLPYEGQLLDPDFDTMGGELEFSQLCSPQFELYESTPLVREPGEWISFRAAKKKPLLQQRIERRRRILDDREHCRFCIPYNGSHTPNYWNTGQKDPW